MIHPLFVIFRKIHVKDKIDKLLAHSHLSNEQEINDAKTMAIF